MNFLKNKLISFVMIFVLLMPKCSFAQSFEVENEQLFNMHLSEPVISESCHDGLCIGDLEIKLSTFKENEKYKFKIDMTCMDQFDFAIVKSFIDSSAKECDQMIQRERVICAESKKILFDLCEKQKEGLKRDFDLMIIEKQKLSDQLIFEKNINEQLNSNIKLYKYILIGTTTLFLGSISYLVFK